ncbi:hypothetical protein CJ030_MR8G005520 [Morella rubra]|uniref:RNase H type-1 domain-containing protein n=1 Tax=Morella rubra TaxID=262757 RepID=A0A6A1USH3_9ROSI|nr:hypothetical protein CJ030_MR8G005526 [Morella rubra]KAB1203092.1 hypothetical protein CJ030_MR8G005520 [Morella rubra]
MAGGIGFRALADLNQAMLSKLIWQFVSNMDSLWTQILRGKYLQHTNFWDVEQSPQASWTLKSMLKWKKGVKEGLCFSMGNGVSISVWKDPWVPSIKGFKPSPHLNYGYKLEVSTVANLIDPVTVKSIHKVVREHLVAWQHKREQRSISWWSPPPLGTIKVNFDVAMRDSFAVGAAVLKDHRGLVVGAVVKKLPKVDPEDGEIWAAQIGLEEARRCGFRKILVEGDSIRAIDAIRSFPKQLNWRSYGRIGDMVNCSSSFDSCRFYFVNRSVNVEAHHLAR